MAEANGAKIIPGPGSRVLSVRDEEILFDLARGVPAPELADRHGLSLQRIYNLKSENRGRFQQIVQAEKETLQILKQETFSDLWIMQEAPRMAGFNEIGQVALRKFLELNAASYVYDPETGQHVATRMRRDDVAAMKIWADMYRNAVRDAVELSGMRPGTLDRRLNQWVMTKHQDPPPPKELEAERAEEEARREARMQAIYNDPVMQQMRDYQRRLESYEMEQAYEGEGDDEPEPEPEPEPVVGSLELVPEPLATAQVRGRTADGFMASVAAAMRGVLPLEFDASSMPDLEMSLLTGRPWQRVGG
jgi:hypothetical protein